MKSADHEFPGAATNRAGSGVGPSRERLPGLRMIAFHRAALYGLAIAPA